MAHGHRLSALDSSFLHLEKDGAHMHVASVTVFEGPPPHYLELLAHVESRLHLVPRFRQRLAPVPYAQGRPVWVDDPYFNLRYHLRHGGLPAPGNAEQLKALAGRVFAQRLDRAKPLWEILLVDRMHDGRFALVAKTHHALVDGISGVDIVSVLFDTAADPAAVAPPARPWTARPLPTQTQLLADALVERSTHPREALRGLRAAARAPRQVLDGIRGALEGVGALAVPRDPAPPSPLNVPIGPHRRYTWVDGDLAEFKAIKTALGGTVNDAVLTVVADALGRFLRHRKTDTRDLVLKAMVPVSVRSDADQGVLGNRVAAVWAPLPVGRQDPAKRFTAIHRAMGDLKASGQAVGAQALTDLAGFAPPTVMSQAARLQARQRFYNLVVTNVPGPQFPLYLLGRRMLALYPVVPLARKQALGVAVVSYDGRLGFGLLGDFDAMADLDVLSGALEESIATLAASAAGAAAPATARLRVAAAPPAAPAPA